MEDSYRRRSTVVIPIDARRSVVRTPDGGDIVILARSQLEVLGRCTSFRTLDEHTAQIAAAHKPRADDVQWRKLLGELVQAGLLVSKRTFVERACAAAPASAAPAIDAVCMATRDRPEAIERCIRSYSANMRSYGRAPAWTVLDSSPDREARRRCRHAAQRIAREGVDVRYAEPDDKEAFARALAKEAGVDLDLVRFGLFDTENTGHDTGANRNALLLAHAGQMLLSVDDDTVCELRRLPGSASAQIEVAASFSPPVTHFESLDAARAALIPADGDILAAHEQWLGRSVGACLAQRRPDDILANALSDDALEVLIGGRARVAATMSGFWGDCATTSPAHYLFSEGPHPDSLPRDEDEYRKLVMGRHVLRASMRPTLSAGATVIAANLGIDLRDLAPPFFPTRRAQDLIFGSLLRRCFEGPFFGFLPLAFGHLPVETRVADPHALWGTAKPKLAALVFHAIQLSAPDVASPGAPRLRLVGRHLRELASLAWPEFEGLLVPRAWQAAAADLRRVQDRLSVADPSSPWARDARGYRDALLTTMRATDLALPESLRANRSREEACALMQRLVGCFGALLEVWPDLFMAAKNLRERGVTLAAPV